MSQGAEQVRDKAKVENSAVELMYSFAVMPRADQMEILAAIAQSKPNFTKHLLWWNRLLYECEEHVQVLGEKPAISEIEAKVSTVIDLTKQMENCFAVQAQSDFNSSAGIKKGYFVIIEKSPVKNGNFAAVFYNAYCQFGFYSEMFDLVSLEFANPGYHPHIYGAAEIVVIGKIIGYCKSAKSKKLYPLREVSK